MSETQTIHRSESIAAAHHGKARSAKYEIVTVLARRDDYDELKKKGGPLGSQIAIAMRHYLNQMQGIKGGTEMPSSRQDMGLVTTFQCGIPKILQGVVKPCGHNLKESTCASRATVVHLELRDLSIAVQGYDFQVLSADVDYHPAALVQSYCSFCMASDFGFF